MKFVILDDNNKTKEMVKSIIKREVFTYDIPYEILEFSNCSEKLKKEILDVSSPKTYILSIDLKQNISGIDIGEYIRKIDWNSYIIFLTSHGNMFETAHRKVHNVFEFIEKYQQMEKRLSSDIKSIIKHNIDDKILIYTYYSSIFKIYYKSIKYIKRDTSTRKLFIYTQDKEYESNITIKEMLNKLDNRFIQVSRSIIINKDYVLELNWCKNYCILKGNIRLHISKNYKVDNVSV